MRRIAIFTLTIIILSSCKDNHHQQKSLSEKEKGEWLSLGDSISMKAQNVLLQNVAAAIQKGGTDYAVDFCNINAVSITDSVADKLKVHIQRLSNKNRNTANAIETQMDSLAWQKIQLDKTPFVERSKAGDIFYYKPISIGMPTCVKCHGSKTDISESTQKIIAQKYPNDKATGYKMGDLRGMWKIKMEEYQ